jgi:c(7)-type cytochrome triheme protein
MKKAVLAVVLVVAVAFAFSAFAVPPGKTIEFPGGAMGKVVFDGQKHADAGLKCTNCHPAIFQMKKGSAEIKAPHEAGQLCFTCHDGTKAFDFKANCSKCHVK